MPALRPGCVLVRVRYCGICGSDLHAAAQGELPDGTVMGHEIAGIVDAVAPDVTNLAIGDAVAALSVTPCGDCNECRRKVYRRCPSYGVIGFGGWPGGYAQYIVLHHSVVERLPTGLELRWAAATEPLMVALHAVRSSAYRIGDSAVIIGAGPIGLLVLQCARLANPAGDVYVIEPSTARRHVAQQLGATAVFAPDPNLPLQLQQLTEIGPDVVFECAGASGTLQTAIDIVRAGGQVKLVGVHTGEDEINTLTMISKEVEVQGSLGGVPLFRSALRLLAHDRVTVAPLISKVIPLQQLNEMFQALEQPHDQVMVLVDPWEEA